MTQQEAIAHFLAEIGPGGSVGVKLNKSFPEYSRHRDSLAMQLGQQCNVDPRIFIRAETDQLAAALCK